MSKKKKYLRKLLAIPLSTAMIAGVGIALSAGISESVLTVNAVESTIVYGDFSYQLLEDETVCITGYSGSDSAVTIPSSINEKTVYQ